MQKLKHVCVQSDSINSEKAIQKHLDTSAVKLHTRFKSPFYIRPLCFVSVFSVF